jgi:ankyrin repeat protein
VDAVDPFESTVDAIVQGDLDAVRRALDRAPALVRDRSARPHHATLLHYVAANGVEDERQITPPTIVEIATVLLERGAEPDALADMYGGRHTTLSMLVSSTPPAVAGRQVPLVECLLDFGADVNGRGDGAWTSPLMTALAFGYRDAAEALGRRGAHADTLPAAAGLGRDDAVARLLDRASAGDRHRALALAAQHGHASIVARLLDAGEDPNRYNPPALHAHSTPLHQAAAAGHVDVVRLLVARGARVDIKDTVYHATAREWANHCGQKNVVGVLGAKGATD